MPRRDPATPFVSRAGAKLAHALDEFGLDVTGLICADFGCNVGGFTDCLLQRGAELIYALDTGYGTLAWKLRNDPRVVVMERTNALNSQPSEERGRETLLEQCSPSPFLRSPWRTSLCDQHVAPACDPDHCIGQTETR